ncbi:neo-calmodulin isoform X2 [Hydra vulgaris]|uniref:Neo-calmodulin isoform X2 n=1 Tax=Hydra vulgaris TaxID=6087 RepID=A0ABM4D3P1_HYDVU|nr:neo-calmodulin isoform X2 [Hydra vulgaris]
MKIKRGKCKIANIVREEQEMAQTVTPESMTALKEAFQAFDKNDDGFISKEELTQVMFSLGHVMSTAEIDQMISLVDTDGNGLIDFKEFLSLMNTTSQEEINDEEEMKILFTLIDANQDGFLCEKEIRNMMKGLGEKVKKKHIRKMIKEADINKDGKISFNEFKRMVSNGNFLVK